MNWSCSAYFWELGNSIEKTDAGRWPASLLSRRVLHNSSWEFLLRADRTQHMQYEASLNVHFHLKEYSSAGGCIGLNSLFIISLLGGEGLAITKSNLTSWMWYFVNGILAKLLLLLLLRKKTRKKWCAVSSASNLMLINPFLLIMFSPFYFNVEMHRQRGLHFQKMYMAFNKNCCQITSVLKRDTEFTSSVV